MKRYYMLTVRTEDERNLTHIVDNLAFRVPICGYVIRDTNFEFAEETTFTFEQFINLANRYVQSYFKNQRTSRVCCPNCLAIAYKETFKL